VALFAEGAFLHGLFCPLILVQRAGSQRVIILTLWNSLQFVEKVGMTVSDFATLQTYLH